ncbi:putative F-box protein [Podospora australis]|uniref:F-box protein n=1 Tax=Podospora australis TaxID=1536484 RepID=A0AAN7AJP1_9PEZI|nr:putative F-box protein [Podospora australis]
MSSADANPDLEAFREQWRAEVRARQPYSASSQPQQHQHHHHHHRPHLHHHAVAGPSTAPAIPAPLTEPPRKPPPSTKKPTAARDEDDDFGYSRVPSFYDSAVAPQQEATLENLNVKKEPVTALEHYEKAVEREAAGNLGDSLALYRKAFRMDDRVDQQYKNKHFPRPPPKQTAPSAGPSHPAAASTQKQEQPLRLKDLIQSFAGLSIEPAPPEMEGMPQPPSPISTLPDEILVHILRDVAILDVGDFVRLAQVCKRLAFLVSTEDRIWRRVCLGSEFGFGGMHYYWQKQITWEPLTDEDLEREADEAAAASAAAKIAASGEVDGDSSAEDDDLIIPMTLSERAKRHDDESTANTLAYFSSVYSSSWLRMFRLRPRIRFNGCYISTVNYQRSGQASSNQSTWGSPILIVTYYRYLRFFRDGTCISLLTTAEPADVVHHLTRENVALHAGGAMPHLPSFVVKPALRGRWRLSRTEENTGSSSIEAEADLIVETEGVSKYIFRLDLSLKTAGKGARNNKLAWRGFYSYDRLADDWAEFTLKNDKPFYFSRVKSYGVMGA